MSTEKLAKRLFDVVVAGCGLVLLAPLLLGIALAIKLDGAGPVLFRQIRVGRHGVAFRIHKFRTMAVAAPGTSPAAQPQVTAAGDRRVTRVGRVLRRTKLDELPQLIDVLTGSMSLVGPRPEVPRYVALYPDALRRIVLSVRPGITDLATLHYRHEETLLARAADAERAYVQEVLPAKLQLSARYVEEASFGSDLRLLLATLRAVWR